MNREAITITEDRLYKPSSPDKPGRRFFIDTESYRWEVFVWRYEIKETGTPVYHARTDEGHSAYGLTANETLNDLAGIMRRKLAAEEHSRKVALDEVRNYLDPRDAAAEDIRIARALAGRPFIERLFGSWRA
ncbi:MAG TPA: hypothetical protein VGB23_05005 [Nitrospirota bacterium]|jgi:hypothetical protein